MLLQLLSTTARQHPHHDAVIYRSTHVTYAQLLEQVHQLMHGLVAVGVGATDPVALLLPNAPSFLISVFAIAGLGGLVVPLDPRFRRREVDAAFRAYGIRAVISDERTVGLCREILSQWPLPVAHITTGTPQGQTLSFNSLLRAHAGALPPSPGPDTPVLAQASSGSAGQPKRVVRTQQQCWWEAENFMATAHLQAEDRIFCVIPFFHAHGFGNCVLAAVRSGATLLILDEPTPFIQQRERALALLEHERGTVFPGVPHLFRLLAETPRSADLSALRLCFSAGGPLPHATFEIFRRRFAVPIRQLYGCTEAGSVAINMDADPRATVDSVGTPMRGVHVKVIDETGVEQPPGVSGEIVIRSPAMARGYVDAPQLTRLVFRGGDFFSGDLGHLDAAGRLFITGRKTLFIDVRGNKVDPAEVEAILSLHPAVREVAVIGVQGSCDGEDMVKAIVVRQRACETEELLAFCQERLATFKVPTVMEFRDGLPKSPLGKVLREELVSASGSHGAE